ncbi:phosphotransferase family protein, partial [Rhodoferax sp. UBA5149]|uniref:phosphotransferase family protein n=1 Tax=Rhodoferax sp. UBA5149 TaxID=1947379 RepID=UPI0025D5E977
MSDFDHFVGTQAVSEKQAFDVAALSVWLTKNLPGFAGPLSVESFKGGQSNPTYKLNTPLRSYVMRAKPGPVAKLLPSAHAIEREFAVMSGLYGTDVPVPHMHCLCEDETVIGRAFYVMEFMQGRILWDQALPGMTPPERGAIYDEMNRVISALHTVKFAERGLASYGKPGNYFDRQISRWSKQYVASITQPIEEMDKLMAWLPQHIPAMARADHMVSIVHGDYRLDNLMFHPTEPRIIAVLDWELSTLGHPLADFSYHCMAWHIPP